VEPLQPPDTFFVNAAAGWLGLGRPDEAAAELDRVSPAAQAHPDVLEMRWATCAGQSHWDAAVKVAEQILAVAPERPTGWLHRAYALRRAPGGGLQRAWDALRPAADRFPNEPIIAYNLACYACQMGQLDEARAWLQRALETGDRDRLKEMALHDEDLAPLRDELQQL
jgi:Flp pilus assembly protein TadD